MSTPGNSPTSTLSPRAQQFVASVLRLRPQVAVFDCDGTLWNADAGELFFYWEMERGLLSPRGCPRARARYEEYRAGRVGEEQMCAEMVTINRGVACETLHRAARELFAERIAPVIFPEMEELTAPPRPLRLRDLGGLLYQ